MVQSQSRRAWLCAHLQTRCAAYEPRPWSGHCARRYTGSWPVHRDRRQAGVHRCPVNAGSVLITCNAVHQWRECRLAEAESCSRMLQNVSDLRSLQPRIKWHDNQARTPRSHHQHNEFHRVVPMYCKTIARLQPAPQKIAAHAPRRRAPVRRRECCVHS